MKVRNIALIVFIIFSLCLLSLYLIKRYNQINAPKIVLESKSNPTEIKKPEPMRNNMSSDMIESSFEETSISEDSLFDVDTIE